MAVIARIIGLAVLTSVLGVWMGYAIFAQAGDCTLPCFCLGCVGAVTGAVAGAGREIASAMR